MIPIGATPLININGVQGSGKTILSRFCKDLIDPTSPTVSALPTTERNFFISAHNAFGLAYDNLSCMTKSMMDLLCSIITGAGYCTRKLHTDTDEIIFDGKRVIILNGIPNVLSNPDICQRSIFLETLPIPEEERLPENILLQKWDKSKPRILGGFYKAISVALKNINNVKLNNYNRMADFEQWVAAGIDALPFTLDEFRQASEQNQQQINDEAIEADPVASAIAAFITQCGHWSGTATELLYQLSFFTSEDIKRTHHWPTRPNKLAEKLRRIAVFLNERGIRVEFRKSGSRFIHLFNTALEAQQPSEGPDLYQR